MAQVLRLSFVLSQMLPNRRQRQMFLWLRSGSIGSTTCTSANRHKEPVRNSFGQRAHRATYTQNIVPAVLGALSSPNFIQFLSFVTTINMFLVTATLWAVLSAIAVSSTTAPLDFGSGASGPQSNDPNAWADLMAYYNSSDALAKRGVKVMPDCSKIKDGLVTAGGLGRYPKLGITGCGYHLYECGDTSKNSMFKILLSNTTLTGQQIGVTLKQLVVAGLLISWSPGNVSSYDQTTMRIRRW